MSEQPTTQLTEKTQNPDGATKGKQAKERGPDSRLIWGPILILGGLLFLAQNLGMLGFLGAIPEAAWALFWMAAFGVGGLAFLVILFLNTKENWWMAIPGFALLGLGATSFVSQFLPFFPFQGSIFLGNLGLGFFLVYLLNREMWWGLIPGGVLTTLSVVAAVDDLELDGFDTGPFFFLGLAATFTLVALAPTGEGRNTWAWIPAGVLGIFALALLFSLEWSFNLIWPVVIILIGAGILARALLKK
jgi:hypothetical protein